MLRNLDTQTTGLINWRTMFTYFVLLQSPIAQQADIDQLAKSITATDDGLVSKEEFLKVSRYFALN
jgi:hypothetical protein